MSARPRKRGRRGGSGAPQEQPPQPSVKREDLVGKTVAELRAIATELGIDAKLLKKKEEFIDAVFEAKVKSEGFIEISGVLDVLPEGYGFIRTSGYLPGDHDVYVSMSVVRRNELRRGDVVRGQVRPPKETEKYPALQRLDTINDMAPELAKGRKRFADLTPVYPDQRLRMEHGKEFMTARTIDMVAPIGKGQRGLIVSPPKAGKTTVLKDIAAAISANDPDVHLMCLLVDERPEEVTDMERSIHGEVLSSTFDMPADNHIAVAELVMERAKRLVESGRDVVILLDSITRLARAYNLAQPASGRILSGGVDSQALYPPKKFFGAARNIEFGGSLTILATALVDTGSKMDEVIFEEFKGTGNMELRLDRGLADRRIFPAIDVITSGTRKEELLLDPQEAPFVWGVRRVLHGIDNPERAIDMLIKGLKQTTSNQEFLVRMAKQAQVKGNGLDL
jgi:transcription termination factor Rho